MAGDHDWLGNDAKTRVERAVVALEAQTSAELVVTVRQSSGLSLIHISEPTRPY